MVVFGVMQSRVGRCWKGVGGRCNSQFGWTEPKSMENKEVTAVACSSIKDAKML